AQPPASAGGSAEESARLPSPADAAVPASAAACCAGRGGCAAAGRGRGRGASVTTSKSKSDILASWLEAAPLLADDRWERAEMRRPPGWGGLGSTTIARSYAAGMYQRYQNRETRCAPTAGCNLLMPKG